MNNNDAFGCTTFRKGNYFGRSYDFYCNDVASSVLHTGRIEGVRYESIGMSGSSFSSMKKDKAIDGTIDKATMNTLFSSIVDGINEKGVAISTLVVPKGDKGITTGTNPSKPSIPAKLVSRVVVDKAYSAKHAIKLLSELNIKQTWGTEYELHWMIADANDTYIVETVNNRLSYRGPSSVTGELDNSIVDGYDGQLEADVVTNFYISGFKSSFNNNYVEGESSSNYYRLYEVPEPLDGDEECYYYANGDDLSVLIGGLRKSFNIDPNSELYNIVDDNKYYILAEKSNGAWEADGFELRDEPLYHKDGTLVDIPSLFDFTEGEGVSYNTFEMPVTNPTVTNYGAGLERYKIVKDAIKDATLSSDEDAMEIINLVQYTNAYKNDTAWYSEFVSHSRGVDNRADVSEGSAYVNGINELKATYQSIFSEGGKEAVRALGAQLGEGASWHSNHQCVYDLANKTMLVYPSENGEVAYRVDIHGEVEDEAVEIGGGSEVDLRYITESGGYYNYVVSPKNCFGAGVVPFASPDGESYFDYGCSSCEGRSDCLADPNLKEFWDFLDENPSYEGFCTNVSKAYLVGENGEILATAESPDHVE